MAQPAEVEELSQPLIDAYRRAWERVLAEQNRLMTDPLAFRRRARLAEVRRNIEAEMDELDTGSRAWIRSKLPEVFALGGQAGAQAAGIGDFAFNQIATNAVQQLATGIFHELLDATKGVRDSTKKLIREVARDEALQKAIEGKTAKQAAREMERVIAKHGITSVIYKNGAQHGLAGYSEMAMRTTTAKAYNSGTLHGAPEVKFFEIFDGPFCGLETHYSPNRAMGMVVDRATAERYPISHPNCRRSFGPRPDVQTPEEAKKAAQTATEEQRLAQIEQDAQRGDPQAIEELYGDSTKGSVTELTELEADRVRELESALSIERDPDLLVRMRDELQDLLRREQLTPGPLSDELTRLKRDPAELRAEIEALEARLKTAPGGGARARIRRQIEERQRQLDELEKVQPELILPNPRIAQLEGEIEQLQIQLKNASGGRVRAKVKAEIEARRAELDAIRNGTVKPEPPINPDPPKPQPGPTPLRGRLLGGSFSSELTDEQVAAHYKSLNKFWTGDRIRREVLAARIEELPSVAEIRKAHPGWTTPVAERERARLVNDIRKRLGFGEEVKPPPIKPDPKPAPITPVKPAPPKPVNRNSLLADRIAVFQKANEDKLSALVGQSNVSIAYNNPARNFLQYVGQFHPQLAEEFPDLFERVDGEFFVRPHYPSAAKLDTDIRALIDSAFDRGLHLRGAKEVLESKATRIGGSRDMDQIIGKYLTDSVAGNNLGVDGLDRMFNLEAGRKLDSTVDQAAQWYGRVMHKKVLSLWQRDIHVTNATRVGFRSDAKSRQRAFYQQWTRTVHIGGRSARTTVHEMGHAFENGLGAKTVPGTSQYTLVSGLQEDAKQFLRYRANGERATEIYRGSNELGFRDDFINHYMGKEYTRDTELISMGMELMYAEPAKLYLNDPEMFWWIVGILRGEL